MGALAGEGDQLEVPGVPQMGEGGGRLVLGAGEVVRESSHDQACCLGRRLLLPLSLFWELDSGGFDVGLGDDGGSDDAGTGVYRLSRLPDLSLECTQTRCRGSAFNSTTLLSLAEVGTQRVKIYTPHPAPSVADVCRSGYPSSKQWSFYVENHRNYFDAVHCGICGECLQRTSQIAYNIR